MENATGLGRSKNGQAKTFIVINPAAGTTDADAARATLEDALSEHGVEYKIHLTRKDDNIPEIVGKAIDSGFQRVAAIGGDGTVSLVAAALVNRNIPLGILPAGSGNVLARDLGIPLELPDALKLLLNYTRIRTIDAMQVDDKFFFLNVSAGMSSLIMQKTKRQDKRRWGMLAYVWRFIEQINRFRPYPFRVTIDGKENRLLATEVLIANASFMGVNPYFHTKREIKPDDGALDVCVVVARKPSQLPALIFEQITRRTTQTPTIEALPAKNEIILDSRRRLPVQADGELAGATPVTVKVHPRALQVIVPE